MTKRRAIISYDKLTIDQKKQILKDFPDGYINHLTTIKTPTGEIILEADIILSAVGVIANIENIGLESVGIKTEKGKIIVDKKPIEIKEEKPKKEKTVIDEKNIIPPFIKNRPKKFDQ